MKIRPVVAQLFHAEGRTDMTKLIVAFRNFAKATNKTFTWTGHVARMRKNKTDLSGLVGKFKVTI